MSRWQHRRLINETARVLATSGEAVEAIFTHAQFDSSRLQRLSLAQLAALPGVTAVDAEKVFYLVQWERLQAHLELHGALPEGAELAPLLATLAPIFERHFRAHDRLNAAFLTRYRALLTVRQRAWWQRPCLELLPNPPTIRLLVRLGL